MSEETARRAVIIKNKIRLTYNRILPALNNAWTYTIKNRVQLRSDMTEAIYTPLVISHLHSYLDDAHAIVLFQEETREEYLKHLVDTLHHQYPTALILVVARQRPIIGSLGWINDYPRCATMKSTSELAIIEAELNRLMR